MLIKFIDIAVSDHFCKILKTTKLYKVKSPQMGLYTFGVVTALPFYTLYRTLYSLHSTVATK